ncbi:predicted protein [Naegleria gruberi]|uniref:Predicted protein n=1 Tax=Naegleria gruberi TaxID=5762 RepID=D2VA26_NAEGR|nr:uncharacterized protein NAEGRDRAFT_65715 [Naegleria gruberi]EFC46356.1 predicted protein [Naegleria gruberi]|eukprot:XP_002679100.1 predicted protein [Naegleria gruberi strain NEG-M]
MCILYHRQNGGEYALCIFKDKKMTDLCPLTIEKTEISIVLNPSQNNNNSKQRSVLQILSENLQGMNVEYYLQFESELQLLSVYTALDKSLMYNGVDIKESIPSFNSLLITYSSRQMKDEVTSPRAPVKFKWCEKYVEQYASGSTSVVTESLRTKSTEKKQVKSFRKTEDNNDSSDSSSGRGARLSQTDNSYSPVDDTRRRYLEDNDDSLGSRHYIPSGDDNTDSDGGRRRHREAIIAKSSPIQSSPLLERKFSEEDRYRPTSNDSDGDSSPTPKIPPPQEQQPTSTNSSSTIQDSSNNSTTTTPGKKVIKRVIKRVPAKNATE